MDGLVHLDSKGPWQQRWPAVARRLRRRIDLAVLFPIRFVRRWLPGWRLQAAARLCALREIPFLSAIPGAASQWRGQFQQCPAIDAYNRLAIEAVPKPGHGMELFTTRADEAAADNVWKRAGFTARTRVVCLNPGAAFGAAKHWPTEYFAQLARLAGAKKTDLNVLVLCGPAERDLVRTGLPRPAGRQGFTRWQSPIVDRLDEGVCSSGRSAGDHRQWSKAFRGGVRPARRHAFWTTHISWTETYYARAIHLQKRVTAARASAPVCPVDHRCMRLFCRTRFSMRRCRRLNGAIPAGHVPMPDNKRFSGPAWEPGKEPCRTWKSIRAIRHCSERQGLRAPEDFLALRR